MNRFVGPAIFVLGLLSVLKHFFTINFNKFCFLCLQKFNAWKGSPWTNSVVVVKSVIWKDSQSLVGEGEDITRLMQWIVDRHWDSEFELLMLSDIAAYYSTGIFKLSYLPDASSSVVKTIIFDLDKKFDMIKSEPIDCGAIYL